ncbi:cytochrome C [Pontibacter sp. 172403-2]|uniref:cytochrome C n=1 Tax=Pontibacter rufus TaxID=2791028 RepID=UPI0018AFE418|nr:cytochrome C [Pontibacter sp. 172403-2]MBF9254144.1 cytochrome C [Pontibacter sp. 172403-2]
MEDKSSVVIFIDDNQQPVGTFKAPINFELDTRKLIDGEHVLRIVSKDPSGREGIRKIPFVVRNGPDITVEGIKENEVVDGVLPLMVSAYGKGDQKVFLIEGSETPRSIPGWVWILHIVFGGWALYYLITQFTMTP